MPKIIPFPKSRKKRPMITAEYLEVLDTLEALVEDVYLDKLEEVRKILVEMRFSAHFNQKFREQTIDQLYEMIRNLYAKSQGE
jgi:hypothetical protein